MKTAPAMMKLAAVALAAATLMPGAYASQNNPPPGYVPLEQYGSTRDGQRAPAPKTPSGDLFEAVRGASLRATLDRWAQVSGWQPVVWKLPEDTDFTLGASGRFQGDFLSSTKALINALGPEANLRVKFHHANRVLVVEPMQ